MVNINSVIQQITIDGVFVAAFLIVSLPVIVSAIFVYGPTLLIILIIIICSMILCSGINDITSKTVIYILVSFVSMSYLVTIVVSSIEYYSTNNWSKAYVIAISGEYCYKDDYFAFEKWAKYPNNIKFLIISWFFF